MPSFLQGDPGEPGLNGVRVKNKHSVIFNTQHFEFSINFRESHRVICMMVFKGRSGDHGMDGAKGDRGDIGLQGQKGNQVH